MVRQKEEKFSKGETPKREGAGLSREAIQESNIPTSQKKGRQKMAVPQEGQKGRWGKGVINGGNKRI